MVDLIKKAKDAVIEIDWADRQLEFDHCDYGEYQKMVAPYRKAITLDNLREWLSSFDTSSATKCFEAVQILKERLEKNEKEKHD